LSPAVEVVRTVLELRSPEQLRAAPSDDPLVRFARQESPNVERYRRLYRAVGHRWYWRDRNAWTDEQLAAHLASPDVLVWECLVADEPAGFFELVRHADGAVEIAYFGLTDSHIGRGLGKAMLTRAATEAWALGPTRVWLHTCTLDSPHALPNYLARGFTEVRQESYTADLPNDD
jgi:GNAT superfamily N-acetyltransferase